MTATGYSVLCRDMMWYFTFALTSFLWTAENSAAACSPSVNAGSHTPALPRYFWEGHPSLACPLGPRDNSRLQFAFFPALTLKQPFYHLFIPKTVVFRNFSLRFPLCQHGSNLRQQCLNVCVIPFPHDKAPRCSLFSYIWGPFVTVRFYWSGSERKEAPALF